MNAGPPAQAIRKQQRWGGGGATTAPGMLGACIPHRGCLMEMIAGAWVSAYHAAFRGTASIEQENAEVRMSIIHQDLESCASRLASRELELGRRVDELTRDAVARKRAGDLSGAKKRLVERKRVQSQRDAMSSSLSVVEMHINTIEGTELNRSILETLRASGDALRRLGAATGGIEEVERIVIDVEQQVESASEISRVIHAANVSGTINSMGHDVMTEEDLEAELSQLLLEDDGPGEAAPAPPQQLSMGLAPGAIPDAGMREALARRANGGVLESAPEVPSEAPSIVRRRPDPHAGTPPAPSPQPQAQRHGIWQTAASRQRQRQQQQEAAESGGLADAGEA